MRCGENQSKWVDLELDGFGEFWLLVDMFLKGAITFVTYCLFWIATKENNEGGLSLEIWIASTVSALENVCMFVIYFINTSNLTPTVHSIYSR